MNERVYVCERAVSSFICPAKWESNMSKKRKLLTTISWIFVFHVLFLLLFQFHFIFFSFCESLWFGALSYISYLPLYTFERRDVIKVVICERKEDELRALNVLLAKILGEKFNNYTEHGSKKKNQPSIVFMVATPCYWFRSIGSFLLHFSQLNPPEFNRENLNECRFVILSEKYSACIMCVFAFICQ